MQTFNSTEQQFPKNLKKSNYSISKSNRRRFVLVPGLPSEESKTGDDNACFIGRLLFMYNIMYKIPWFFFKRL